MEVLAGRPHELTPQLLESVERYRYKVFVEMLGWQLDTPPGLERDQFDHSGTLYLAARDAQQNVIGTARLMPTGQIGRMAVLPEHRKNGVGRRLLELAVAEARRLKLPHVFLHAQSHARGFYEKSGFVAHGDEFEEAGIPHVEMTLRAVR